MNTFLLSIFPMALAEMGDKTQLLALFLATRFKNKYAIIMGILLATLANHAFSVWLGIELTHWLSPKSISWIIGISFIAVGVWLLKPDKETNQSNRFLRHGAFITTLLLFSLAEMGDKTQIGTILLAAQHQNFLSVMLGSTLGLLIANIPIIFLGNWLMTRLPFKAIRTIACISFLLLGFVSLIRIWL